MNLFKLLILANFFLITFIFPKEMYGQEGEFTLRDTTYAMSILTLADSLYSLKKYDDAINQMEVAKNIFGEIYSEDNDVVATCWDQIGFIFYKKGDMPNAIKNQKNALDIYRKNGPDDNPKIGEMLNNIGSFYVDLGEFQKSLNYHKKAIHFKEKFIPNNIKSLSSSYGNIATTYQYLSKVDSAIIFHNKSLDLRKKIYGKESFQVAYILNNLGSSYRQVGKFKEQLECTLEAKRLFKKYIKETHVEFRRCYNNLGFAYKGLGDFTKAIANHQKYLELTKEVSKPKGIGLAIAHNNLAIDYIEVGKYYKAKSLAEKALTTLPKGLSKNYMHKAAFNNTLGRCYGEIGDNERAIQFYEKALNIRLKRVSENQSDLSIPYYNLAKSFSNKGNQEKAINYYQKAIDAHLTSFIEIHPSTPLFYEGMGLAFLRLKNYSKAESFFNKSLLIKKELFDKNHVSNSYTLQHLGSVKHELEDYQKAITYYEEVIRLRKEEFGNIHPQVGKGLHALAKSYSKSGLRGETEDTFMEAMIAFNYKQKSDFSLVNSIDDLIRLLHFIGHYYKSEFTKTNDKDLLIKAKNHYQQAIEAIEYKSIFISTNSKNDLYRIAKPIFEEIISLYYLSQKERPNSFSLQEELFSLAEKAKAKILLEALQENSALYFSEIPESLIKERYDIKVKIASLKKVRQVRIRQLGIENDTSILNIANQISDLELQSDSLKTQLKNNFPSYFRTIDNMETVSLDEIQEKFLTPNQSLVEYVLGDSNSYVYLVNSDTFIIKEIPMDFLNEEFVTVLRKGLIKYHTTKGIPSSMLSTFTKEYISAANQLYQKYIEPIKSSLKKEIIIIPDGLLGYVPFELLLTHLPDNLVAFHKYPYLIKKHKISYCYSATLLRKMRNQIHPSQPTKKALALAPFFNGDLKDLIIKVDSQGLPVLRHDTIQSLPFSGEEAAKIAKITGGEQWLGQEATKNRFIREVPNYRLLHLSTHGIVDDEHEEDTFLAFATSQSKNTYEKLSIRDIYNLRLNADMVVLSACEAGIGKLQRGEGIISLARAFAYAGSKSIITTFWSVDDKQTSLLMEEFYKLLANGKTKDEALRLAKLKFIETNKNLKAHPFFWGGIFNIGDMSSLLTE